jgi:hypothetical protein
MAANIAPIFPKKGNIGFGVLTAANTAKDGTGTVLTLFTADATNGSRLDRIRMRPAGTNTASVARFFINNGGATTSASNNSFLFDVSLPSTTLTELAALNDLELPCNFVLPPGYRITCAIGTAVAAGWAFTALGGDY